MPPLPPVELRFMGESDREFLEIGDGIADLLERWADLRSGCRLLDMGSGYGRLAHALRRRNFRGRYLGLDVLRRHVEWCRRHLGGRGWRFRHLDIRNARYNPSGRLPADEVCLRRYARKRDLIVASSLFTHLEPGAVRHYLDEFAKILVSGGRLYASFFLFDPEGEDLSGAEMSFAHDLDGVARSEFEDEALHAVSYPRSWLERQFERLGLKVTTLSYGTWSLRATGDHYQDIYVLERIGEGPTVKNPFARSARGEIKRVQLGCGPKNSLPGWWNVDIRDFDGVDQVLDATKPWPFRDLEYVYGEHFLEHLPLEGAVDMLDHAWRSVRPGGTLRLSTPALEWVLATHFDPKETRSDRRIANTFMTNRAFHGWGHQFLYSRDLLCELLETLGWRRLRFCDYGQSEDPVLADLERHGNFRVDDGIPSVWIVEAKRAPERSEPTVERYRRQLDQAYVKYTRDGH